MYPRTKPPKTESKTGFIARNTNIPRTPMINAVDKLLNCFSFRFMFLLGLRVI